MKNSVWVALSLACASGLTSTACVTSIQPSPPSVPLTPVGEPPPSTVELSIAVPLKAQFAAAETDIPSSLRAEEYLEFFGTGGPNRPSCGIGCGYDVSRSPLSFDSHSNEIAADLSFSYWLSCTKRIPCRGRLVSASCGKNEPRRRGTVSLTTRMNLLPTWTATATTKNNGVVAQDQCAMGPLGVVNLTDKLVAGFTGLGKPLDARLNQGLSGLRPKADSAWQVLSNPIQIDADTWLQVKPQRVSISAIQTSADGMQLAAILNAHPAVNIGDRPPAAGTPLPDATSDAMQAAMFEVYMPVKADYSAVEAALKENLKIGSGGVHYPPTGNHYLRTTDVTLSAYGQKAVFRVEFRGLAKGYAYFVGTPAFDPNTNLLSFPDLDYAPDTKRVALESLQWVNQDALIQDLRRRLVVDLAEPLTHAKSKLLDALNHAYGDVQLAGSIPTLSLVSVYTDSKQGQLVAYFNMSGAVKATVQ